MNKNRSEDADHQLARRRYEIVTEFVEKFSRLDGNLSRGATNAFRSLVLALLQNGATVEQLQATFEETIQLFHEQRRGTS
jgi:hypothetical protein